MANFVVYRKNLYLEKPREENDPIRYLVFTFFLHKSKRGGNYENLYAKGKIKMESDRGNAGLEEFQTIGVAPVLDRENLEEIHPHTSQYINGLKLIETLLYEQLEEEKLKGKKKEAAEVIVNHIRGYRANYDENGQPKFLG